MVDNSSENLIFEIVRDLTKENSFINKDQLYNKLSSIVVKYKTVKLNENEQGCNLDYYIEQYLSAKMLDGLAKDTTIKGYKLQLNIFSKELNRNVEDISASHIRVYLSKYDYLKPSSLATKISILKSFFVWLLQEEIIQKDPMKKIKTPKYNKRNVKSLDVDELETLRESCESSRQRAMLEIFYASGCRLSEIRNMNISDIDLQKFSAKVVGKGSKERDVYFSLKAIHHLKKYLKTRDDDCEALFVSERKPHNRLSNRGIQREIRKIVNKSEINKHATVHSLRHTYCSLLIEQGCDLRTVQELMGHESPETTVLYSHVSEEHKRQQHKKYLVL